MMTSQLRLSSPFFANIFSYMNASVENIRRHLEMLGFRTKNRTNSIRNAAHIRIPIYFYVQMNVFVLRYLTLNHWNVMNCLGIASNLGFTNMYIISIMKRKNLTFRLSCVYCFFEQAHSIRIVAMQWDWLNNVKENEWIKYLNKIKMLYFQFKLSNSIYFFLFFSLKK